ncbi:MAG TPA: redoxin domain-containing protein [Acidobacteriaceae bacterium]|jgi:thiol-disulfide isomerase/thioredoxin|nr:redoxin domain-containing protein [Acidobacteriaceae bacterium]
MHQGEQELQQHRAEFAKGSFNKANKIAGGACNECLLGMYEAQLAEPDYKGAIATAERLVELAKTPPDKSVAEYRLGAAEFLRGGAKPKPEELQAAHAALEQALADYPNSPAALYLDGRVLAHMGKMEEAKASFAKCVSCVRPSDPARLRAEHFAEDPSLSLKPMAPPFEVTALDGTKFNLDAMGGRVVLIDFWATWCGPCNEELPHMKKIAKEFAGEPLVILSVSWDDDDAKWRAFIQKNEMTWMQYRDADKSLTRAFGVEAIPHYFTIDSDGVLTSEMMGEGSDVEGRLKKLVAKAREAEKQRETAAASEGGGR